MSVNKYRPHIWVIPEDDANRQIIAGFLLHDAIDLRAVGVRAPAGGWSKVLDVFEEEYLPLLLGSSNTHVAMVIDFDQVEGRREQFEARIPEDLRSRVFVIGSEDEPETLRRALNMTFERIGRELAQNCFDRHYTLWQSPQLAHNDSDLRRLEAVVRPFLFP